MARALVYLPIMWGLLASGDFTITADTGISAGILIVGGLATLKAIWWARGDRDAIVNGFQMFQTEVRTRFNDVNDRIDSMCRRLDKIDGGDEKEA